MPADMEEKKRTMISSPGGKIYKVKEDDPRFFEENIPKAEGASSKQENVYIP